MFLPVLLALMPGSYSMSKDLPTIPHTHVDMVSGAAAAVSFIGELLMIKASCQGSFTAAEQGSRFGCCSCCCAQYSPRMLCSAAAAAHS
jgi:hypothetical protein